MKKLLGLLFFIALIISGCTKDSQTPPPIVDDSNNGFESFEVAEIFATSCADAGCHGTNAEHGLKLLRYDDLIKGSKNRPLDGSHGHSMIGKLLHDDSPYGGEAVIPFKPEYSLLYRLITGDVEETEFRMPYKRTPLTSKQIEAVHKWIINGARNNKGEVPFAQSKNRIYACSQGGDKIYVIDPDYKLVSGIIDVDFNTNAVDAPHNIQIRNNYVYVTLISAGKFIKIDRSTNTIVGQVDGLTSPGMINLSADGKIAYISKSSTAQGSYSEIYVIDTELMTRKTDLLLPVSGLPHAIALTKDGINLYVANMSRDRIDVLNTSTGDPVSAILLSSGAPLVHEPMHMYLSPDDQYLYVNCRTSSKMLIYKTSDGSLLQELQIDDHPMQAAVSGDGNKVYVVSHHRPVITEITKNGEIWNITGKFESQAFHHLYGADLSEDGKYLYVTCSNSTNDFKPRYKKPGMERASLVCVFDTQKRELVKVIDIGSFATGITTREL